MGADQNFAWEATVASALEWWRDAGIDTLADETPRDWFAAPAPPPQAKRPATQSPAAAPEPVAAPLPATLDAFLAWRAGPDAPEAGWNGPRFAPQGDPASDLMILVDMPDREDERLLDGATGRLFDRMLAAIGHSRESVYIAPVCTARPLAGRIAPESEDRLAGIARHHVALAAPKRVLLMGNAPSRALLAADVVRARGSLRLVNLDLGNTTVAVEAVASFHPRLLLERPAQKAEAWKDLQMVVGGSGS
ncbi:uracil-DNA glycosylase family protein [Sphingomonas immobilis]|uniref:Uracil-DNA glycosylase family protein n=1 Tax=Sphingomonas immobilis TaxID=3063997 RepID=A0ABT8ZUL8_9SPHN|nr:uracil-DNA glycosylase family protein [Sphingomonas sp. CA1-15]MDO7841270.1 uracil-DNA glycosylase family protein [Sphingomonas sp. CA1-15]